MSAGQHLNAGILLTLVLQALQLISLLRSVHNHQRIEVGSHLVSCLKDAVESSHGFLPF